MKAILLSLFVLLAAPVAAQERILSYDSQVEVRADGGLDVTERIAVRAEGNSIRRGIYREFPTRYEDRYGNRVVVDLQVVDVLRDGKPEPWFTERKSNGVRINTGNDDFLPVPADFTYTLRYRTTRQMGFFADHDELYWNAIGTGWEFPIERGSVEVRLPSTVSADRIRVEAYTGAQGEKGQAYDAKVTGPGTARWLLTQPLAPHEGLTLVMSFPKGIVAQPSSTQRWLWLLKDNRGVLIALAALAALLVFCIGRWRRLGRDPRPGVIITRYDPPAGHSPAGLRFMQRMGYDTRCFSSDLLSLAVAGMVSIHREKGLLSDDWELEKIEGGVPLATVEQKALESNLFKGGLRK
ncbi:MAG: DUF2207 domain-containing protein, partial [Pseudoxanthomonas sp.]